MFHYCAKILLTELNNYVQAKTNIGYPPITMAISGNYSLESNAYRHIIMRLVDISVALSANANEYIPQGEGFILRKAPETFSLYFLLSINDQENESALLRNLELLAYVSAFFQKKSHFDSCDTPLLQQVNMNNFSVELVKLSATERSMLWTSLRIPYTPSLLYKVGLVFVADTTMGMEIVPTFSSLDSGVHASRE